MKNGFRIIKTKFNTFIVEEKDEKLYFQYSYFEFLLTSFGIKQYDWVRSCNETFDSYEEAMEYAKLNY